MKLWEFLSRLLHTFVRRENRDTEAEMRFHLNMEIEAGLRRGLTRGEAERLARLRAGSVSRSMDAVRDQRSIGWMDGVIVDLRQAWNALRRRPGFLLVAGGVLASAVAVNTLVFMIADGVLFRPLPYRDPDRLVRVFEASESQPRFPLSLYNYEENKRASKTMESIALYTRQDMQLMHEERPERLTSVAITSDFFPTLGVTPALGRNFAASELVQAARVVILSHTFWTSRFHSDPEIVGRTIRLDREDWTVIGVAPQGFQHIGGSYRSPLQGDTVAIWRPLALDIDPGCAKGCHYTNAIARLAPGSSAAAAQEELTQILKDLGVRFPDFYTAKTARLETLSSEVVGQSRSTILVVMAAGILVLLLASINVAGLSIARVLTRRREIGIRQALGSSAWRIMRAVLSENIVLGAFAGTVGLGFAAALLPVLRSILPPNFPRLHEIAFNWPAAIFALVAAVGTSTVAGMVATLRRTAADPNDALAEEARTASASGRTARLRNLLVASEMALACVLCFAAVLLLRSSIELNNRDNGFNPAGAMTFELSFPARGYTNRDQVVAFYAEAGRRIREIPGVEAAGFSTSVPWTGYDENSGFSIDGYTRKPGESISARFQGADDGFVRAIGMRLTQGRDISPSDNAAAPKVVIVNDALARRYFPAGDAVGRVMNVFGAKRQIVGVVRDVHDQPADAAAQPAFWMAMPQQPFRQARGVVRTTGDPLAIVPAVRAALQSIDRELPMADIRSMEEITGVALAERHFALWLCEAFGVLAIALGAIGVYGLLSFSVEQRRREIGIRMALGASRRTVLGMILNSGLLLSFAGTIAGLLMAPAAGRLLSSLLYGVSATDRISLVIAPGIIIMIALLGCVAPAWTAIRTDPTISLREQ